MTHDTHEAHDRRDSPGPGQARATGTVLRPSPGSGAVPAHGTPGPWAGDRSVTVLLRHHCE